MTYLIDQMATEKAWAFSNDFKLAESATDAQKEAFTKHRKRPLFMGDYVENRNRLAANMPLDKAVQDSIHLMRDYFDADADHLNKLNELNLPELSTFKRAYHMSALDNLVVVLDIEPDTSKELLEQFSKIPAHFSEWSTNNGLHLFYKVDLSKLSDAGRTLLGLTVQKIDEQPEGPESYRKFELIMNDHWITFTGKTNLSQIVPLETPVPDVIYDIIESIAVKAAERQLELEEIQVDANARSETSETLAEWILDSSKMIEIEQLEPSQFQHDLSRYEFNVIYRIAGYLQYRIENASPMTALRLGGINLAKVSDQDAVQAIYQVAMQVIPYRDKHATFRDRMPWLMYQAVQAYQRIKASNNSQSTD